MPSSSLIERAVKWDRQRAETGLTDLERAMNYFCLVETNISGTPHLEWLPVDTLVEAHDYADHMLNQHLMPIDAHIYADDERIDTDHADPHAAKA